MKIIQSLILGLSLFSLNASAQEMTASTHANKVWYANGEKTMQLEEQKIYLKAKPSLSMYLVGMGNIKFSHVVPGLVSHTRISQQENLKFIVKVAADTVDLLTLIQIFKVEQDIRKLYRFVEVKTFGTFSGNRVTEMKPIPFIVKRVDEHSYLIELQELPLGEYAIVTDEHKKTFSLFGID